MYIYIYVYIYIDYTHAPYCGDLLLGGLGGVVRKGKGLLLRKRTPLLGMAMRWSGSSVDFIRDSRGFRVQYINPI